MSTPTPNHPYYAFRHGDACLILPKKPLSGASEALFGAENVYPVERALSLVIDAEGGSLMHHGSEDLVAKKWAKAQEMMTAFPGLYDLQQVSIPTNELTEEMLEEINACIACTGRAATLIERLGAMRPAGRPGMYM